MWAMIMEMQIANNSKSKWQAKISVLESVSLHHSNFSYIGN